jgi:protein involved in polysaccharide export with SLBB domain
MASDITAVPDITREDGDRFIVPYKPAVVNVIGAVYNDSALLHQPNRKLSYYLRKAGGGTPRADKGHLFVIRADGSVLGHTGVRLLTGGLQDMRLMPGDTIVVPERLDKVGILKGLKDWSFVVGQLALGAAAIHTLSQ